MNKDITPFNYKGQQHGYWEIHWFNGELFFKCVYNNGKQIGCEERYWLLTCELTKIYYL